MSVDKIINANFSVSLLGVSIDIQHLTRKVHYDDNSYIFLMVDRINQDIIIKRLMFSTDRLKFNTIMSK